MFIYTLMWGPLSGGSNVAPPGGASPEQTKPELRYEFLDWKCCHDNKKGSEKASLGEVGPQGHEIRSCNLYSRL